ncbi:MAG: serine/threonine protein phosphatase [Rhodospirillales bacterium]|nr:serine/threonine protein phosphatase [Rhodospirillales bacterium]
MTPINQKTGPKGLREDGGDCLPGGPRTPKNCRIYAIGDIHGRPDLLRRLHKRIIDDAGDSSDAGVGRKVCVYLGDYVDRGPDSFGVIDMLVNDPLQGFENVFLKGNHEDIMLTFLEDASDAAQWILNGGIETLDSYGIGWSDLRPKIGNMDVIRQAFVDALPESHRNFLSALGLHHQEGDYLFVHAGVRPGRALEEQSAQDLMWIREDFLDWDGDWRGLLGHFVVHGHSAGPVPDIRKNRVGLDTGAWRTNRLTALVLDGASVRFLQT